MKYVNAFQQWLIGLARPNPLRDWFIVLGLVTLLAAILVVVSVYFFLGIRSGTIIPEADNMIKRTPTVSREALQNIVEVFETRTLNYEADNIPTPNVDDPS